MIKIEFSGESFVEVRRQIQEFAVAHLNAKFNAPGDVQVVGGSFEGVPGPYAAAIASEEVSGPASALVNDAPEALTVKPGKSRRSRGRPRKGVNAEPEKSPKVGPNIEVTAEADAPIAAPEDVPAAIQAAAAAEPEKPEFDKEGPFALSGYTDSEGRPILNNGTTIYDQGKEPPIPGKAPKPELVRIPPKTLAEAQWALQVAFDKHGPDNARRCLKKFGAARLKELREDQYSDFCVVCETFETWSKFES